VKNGELAQIAAHQFEGTRVRGNVVEMYFSDFIPEEDAARLASAARELLSTRGGRETEALVTLAYPRSPTPVTRIGIPLHAKDVARASRFIERTLGLLSRRGLFSPLGKAFMESLAQR